MQIYSPTRQPIRTLHKKMPRSAGDLHVDAVEKPTKPGIPASFHPNASSLGRPPNATLHAGSPRADTFPGGLRKADPAGSFVYALCYLVDRELDLASFLARYKNDYEGATGLRPGRAQPIAGPHHPGRAHRRVDGQRWTGNGSAIRRFTTPTNWGIMQ